MRHIQQPSQGQTATVSPNTHSPSSADDAPPKQVALAMDRLGHAARLIADIRLGADRLLEALCVTAQPHQSSKPLHLFQKEDASMRQHLLDLRAVGKQLEESGVLSESLLSRSNSWGLHMPLVCPDGAVVAYAWKRQLAGQAGASAVDRTRLALKAFTDQKRRFFPHLEDENASNNEPALKKPCFSHGVTDVKQNELIDSRSLSDILSCVEKEVPELKIFTYERLDWLKQASALPSQANENSIGALKEHSYHSPRMSPGALGATPADKAGVIELIIPSVFRAVVSLHPIGSVEPDALAFFSPDELHGLKICNQLIYEIVGVNPWSMLPRCCSIFLEINQKQLFILYCFGSAATKICFQKLVVNVDGGYQASWTLIQMLYGNIPRIRGWALAAMLSCAAFGGCNYMHGMIFTFRLFIGADRDFENDHLLLMRLFLLAQVACHHQGRQKIQEKDVSLSLVRGERAYVQYFKVWISRRAKNYSKRFNLKRRYSYGKHFAVLLIILES
ncbi:mediator of RNA polymerase II transcription subunit 27 [Cucumis melo var. makuwa]|uniref:Mediator of RNA polymerase II transcription subunit 27 n=1 Tax=Cucumis melo var. makuwa TaxID=1194695 RepID=A0A5D3DNW2_CUCMM|nr:mediator of RNA polymerase II transcription subunit 27 [Cucumis melo var. makuwa]TYK25317.1 mediator of RNA polymerase II transcription subunit 27 [Cucumis melo var. makuwa]